MLFNLKNEIHNTSNIQNFFPKCIFVPKTNHPSDIKWLYEKLYEKKHLKQLNLFFYMESATSLIKLNEIIKTAFDLSINKYNNIFNLEGFVFGSGN